MKTQFADPIRVHFECDAVTRRLALGLVDNLVLEEELIALNEEG